MSHPPVLKESSCINLRKRFGDNYKISYEPAVQADPSLRKDPFCQLMATRAGELSPQGGTILRLEMPVTSRRRKPILTRLKGRCTILEFADVVAVLFDVDEFESLVDLIEPRKRRKLTEEQRLQHIERLAPFRYRTQEH